MFNRKRYFKRANPIFERANRFCLSCDEIQEMPHLLKEECVSFESLWCGDLLPASCLIRPKLCRGFSLIPAYRSTAADDLESVLRGPLIVIQVDAGERTFIEGQISSLLAEGEG